MDASSETWQNWWREFVALVTKKTKGSGTRPGNLIDALDNAGYRPDIYITFGIHGNILFPDAGYCEFDDPIKAWQHLQRWVDYAKKTLGKPATWKGAFPVGFEVGVCSLVEMAKTYPVWDLLKEAGVEVINPLYSEPYLRHVPEESNVRQLEYGMQGLKSHGLDCVTYASSEHAVHPQLPQLLRGFGIRTAQATVRLAGGGPTVVNPKVNWIGKDGTSIPTIASQSGLPNGHVWHGKIFEELPGLIFLAVARPDLKHVVYNNIEDFANPFPGSIAIAENIAQFEKNRIYFRSYRDVVEDPAIPVWRDCQWSVDEFPIKFMESKLIAACRRCEDRLIQAEAMVTLLAKWLKSYPEKDLHEAWEKLLIAENHDAFVVPFTKPGQYSDMQGIANEYKKWTSSETIEERCVRCIKEADQVTNGILQPELGSSSSFILNWLWERQEIIGDDVWIFPAAGFGQKKEKFIPQNRCATDKANNAIKVFDLHVKVSQWPETITVKEHINRAELFLHTENAIELTFHLKSRLWITYPFGAEPTGVYSGHCLRFYWLEEGVMIAHTGTPYFKRTADSLTLLVPPGDHGFAISAVNSLLEAYQRAWEFFYPPIPIPSTLLKANAKVTVGKSLVPVQFGECIPITIRKADQSTFGRFLCIGNAPVIIKGASNVDFFGEPVKNECKPWRIVNLKW